MANLIPSALKKFKLIDWFRREDYGDEYALQIIKSEKYSFIQTSVSRCEYPSGPYLHISMGQGRFFGLIFLVHKFGFDLDIMTHTWQKSYLDESYDE